MTSWMWPWRSCRSRMARSDVDALGVRLADADQDAGREGDAELARHRDRLEPARGHLVRGAGRGPRPGASSRSEVLSSMMPMLTLTSRSAAQVSLGHEAGVGVRQQPGLLEDERATSRAGSRAWSGGPCGAGTRGARGRGPPACRPGRRAPPWRPAARPRCASASTWSGVIVKAPGSPGSLPERAVAAVVAAERGQRDEDLGRERDAPAVTAIAQRRRGVEEGVQSRGRRVEQGVGLGGVGGARPSPRGPARARPGSARVLPLRHPRRGHAGS